MDGGKTTANWITINNGQFSQGTYIKGTLKTDTANITTATISNGKVTGDFTIDGVLSSNEWVKNIVKAVGGQQYICPTFEATGTTSISCTAATATDVSFTISDSTAITGLTYGGANWNQNSKVMLSGNIQGNKSGAPEIVFSSAQGTVTANMNSTSGKLQIKINYPNANSYFQSGAVTFTNVSVMMYQIMVSGTLYPIGIYLKAYGNDNKNSYIDIYGGTSTTPNARLGLLNGLAAMANGTTPTGWGIATTNGFFDGTIVSNSGTIGGWTIGSTSLSSNTLGTDGSMWLTTADVTAVKFAGATSALTTWRIGAGSKFGVTSDGTCYCSNIQATGGIIGGWTIGSTSLFNNTDSLSSTTSGIYVGTDGILNYADANTFVKITGGVITAKAVDLTGKITASSGSIAGWRIESSYLASGSATAPADNVLLLSPSGTATSYTIAETASTGWMITAGTKFGVNKNGGVYATAGKIGGFTIGTSAIYNTTDSISSTGVGVYVGTDGFRNYKDANTYVNITGGKITAKAVDLSGAITATSGTIGGVTANSSYGLYTNSKTTATSTNSGFFISKAGAIYLGAYNSTNGSCPFQVTSAGVLTADSGSIAGWSFATGSKQDTTANGGHYYQTSLYNHATIGDYEYEIGLRATTRQSPTVADHAFYVKRIIKNGSWSTTNTSLEDLFHVSYDGSLYAPKLQAGQALYVTDNSGSTTYKKLALSAYAASEASTLVIAGQTDIDGSGIGANNMYQNVYIGPSSKIMMGAKTYFSEDFGTEVDYRSVTTGRIDVDAGRYSSTEVQAQINLSGWARSGRLVITDTANNYFGLYDVTNSAWVIKSNNNQSVDIPHSLSVGGTLGTTGNITETKSSGDISIGGNNGTRNGKFLINSSGTLGLYDNTNSAWVIYSDTSQNVSVPHKLLCRTYDTTSRPVITGADTDGNRILRVTSTSSAFRVYAQWGTAGADFETSHDLKWTTSDIRLKENIKPSTVYALDTIDKIQMRQFNWIKQGEGHQKIGFIADELEKIDPRLSYGGELDNEGKEGYKSVDSFYLQGYEVKAIQELHELVKAQADEINELKATIKELKGTK